MGTQAKIELIENNRTYEIDCTIDGHIETVGVNFLALAVYDINMLVKYLKLISLNGLKIYGGLEPYIGDNVRPNTTSPTGAFKLSNNGSTLEVNKDINSPLGLTSINYNDLKINPPKYYNNFDYYDRAYVLNLDTKEILFYDCEGKITLTCSLAFLKLHDSKDMPMGVTMFLQDLNNLGISKEVHKSHNYLIDVDPTNNFDTFFLNSLMIFNNAYTKYEVLEQLNMVEQGAKLEMIEKNDSKFKVGDKVDYVNDYSVCFKNKTITKVNDDRTYEIEPTDTPWISKPEKNLHLAGTWDSKNLDKKLNNGKKAKFLGCDDWGNQLFDIPFKSDSARKDSFTAVEVNGLLNTITDEGEPNNPLIDELQFIGISL